MQAMLGELQPIFNILVSAIVAAGFVGLLVAGTQDKAHRQGKRRYLSYGVGFKAFALLLIPFAAFLVWLMMINIRGQEVAAFLIAIGFVASAIFFPYQAFFVQFAYDDDFIYYKSPLAGDKKVSWAYLSDVNYDWFLQTDFILVEGIGKIYCSSMLNGYWELTLFLEQKTEERFQPT